MEPKYSFVRAQLDSSKRQIADLWAQGLGRLVDRVADEKYRQFYLENPAGRGDCVLLLENATGRAVGVQGFVPRAFWRGDQRVVAAVMADFVVVPEHRSLGPALKLMRTGIELGKDRFVFLYGTPNEKSLAIVRRAGLATVGMFTRYTKVVRSESYWRRRIPSWLVSVTTAAADAAIIGADLGQVWLRGDPLAWEERIEFGPEFDAIWARRRTERVYSDRSRSTLAWRYSPSSSNGPWKISVAAERSGEIVGYIVWRLRNGAAMISDFLYPGSDASLRTFMRSFALYVRRFQVERVSLEFFGAGSVVEALIECGFASRERSAIVCVEHPGCDVSIGQDAGYMTSFDRDHEE